MRSSKASENHLESFNFIIKNMDLSRSDFSVFKFTKAKKWPLVFTLTKFVETHPDGYLYGKCCKNLTRNFQY